MAIHKDNKINFLSFGSRRVELTVVRGKVIDGSLEKITNTHVKSSGGSSQISPNGQIDHPTVSSRNTTDTGFWIQDQDGKDVFVQMKNRNVAVRDGHDVLALKEEYKGLVNWFGCHNYSTDTSFTGQNISRFAAFNQGAWAGGFAAVAFIAGMVFMDAPLVEKLIGSVFIAGIASYLGISDIFGGGVATRAAEKAINKVFNALKSGATLAEIEGVSTGS